MRNVKFEAAFTKAVKKYASISKAVKKKVDMIIEEPMTIGEPLKGNWQGFYSCPVKQNFIIIYLYCKACRKKNDDEIVVCSDCSETADETIKFILLAPHDQAYGI